MSRMSMLATMMVAGSIGTAQAQLVKKTRKAFSFVTRTAM